MLFWILAALLTLAAALAVMRPFASRKATSTDEKSHDIEVYRDQLDELSRDVERGLIGKDEAEQARAEIGRRILKATDASQDTAKSDAGGQAARFTAAAAILAVPLISWGLYAVTGSPGMPAQPLQARLEQDPSNASIEELVARAEAHLADNPQDVRGWQVLAPVYMRLGRFADAQTALRAILRLSGDAPEVQAALGEAIAAASQGIVTADAEAAFEAALKADPANPKARFFLALGRAQEGKMDEARQGWQALQEAQPEGSPWREAAAQALASADGNARGASGGASSAPGPTQEDVAAASQLSGGDRQAMIEGMVSRLDEKLRDNPDDPEGWRRLVQSYMVLKKPDEAREALDRGVAALGADTEAGRALAALARDLGLPGE